MGDEWMNSNFQPRGNGTGFAQIREVYQLLRESEERMEKRLHEMELRLLDAIKEIGNKEEARWKQHEDESQDIRTKLAEIEEEDKITAAYIAGNPPPVEIVKNHIRFFGSLIDYVEKHWKVLSLILLILLILIGVVDLAETGSPF